MEKEDFKNYRGLVLEARQLEHLISCMESRMYTPGAQRYSKTPGTSSSRLSTMADVASRHLDLLDMYREKLDGVYSQLRGVEDAISSLSDPAERTVMRLRYIEGRGWSYICAKVQAQGYSERQMYRLHGFALLKLKEV